MTRSILITGLAALALAGTATIGFAASEGAGASKPGMGQRGAAMNFDAIDADGDGKITAEEMQAYGAQRFAVADTNGDGYIDAAEMQVQMLAQSTARIERRTARMIARMDTDGDGQLSPKEMRAGPRGADAGEDRFALMLARMDTDGDGAISREEMEAARAAWAERGPRKAKKAD